LVFNFNNLDSDLDFSILGELECVGLKTKENLHHPLLVSSDHRSEPLGALRAIPNVYVMSYLLYVVVVSLSLLNEHYLVHDIGNAEATDVLPEFSRLYLSEVKKVLNDVGQEARR
jgi:hypothetical protein